VLKTASLEVNPLELWYHGIGADVFENLDFHTKKYASEKKQFFKSIPPVNPELLPAIMQSLTIPDESIGKEL